MNNVVSWLKSNWVIAVLAVVTLAVLPTGFIIGSGMNGSLKTKLQNKVTADLGELSKKQITYTVKDPLKPGSDLDSLTAAPNPRLIEHFAKAREAVQAQAGTVWTDALKFNKNSHKILVDGLFPAPSTIDRGTKEVDFAKTVINQVVPGILKEMNAGMPTPTETIASRIKDQFERRRQQELAASGGRDLSEQTKNKLADEMAQLRLGEYRRRASEIGVYADAASLADFPKEPPNPPLTVRKCWEMQEQAWIAHDIARAIADANAAAHASAAGGETGVPASVIKRIIKLQISDTVNTGGSSGGGENPPPKSDGITGILAPDPIASVTGRTAGPNSGNQLYDMRTATLEAVVSTKKLPMFIDALARANLMTVVGCDLFRIDLFNDLGDGFDYGSEHVVRAVIRIECILFREWTFPDMPAECKIDRTGVSAEGDGAAPAAAPPPRRQPAAPKEGGGGGKSRRGEEDLPG